MGPPPKPEGEPMWMSRQILMAVGWTGIVSVLGVPTQAVAPTCRAFGATYSI